ncbi:MAG: hypothetical protein B6D39_05585 [Anaerolineae bacterium UTCFX2]|jgi:peptide chain release factor subunit 1|nr:hypothetical protein [Anaerolineae bacterium]MCZ7552366.1 hypothetical protein [Anaerolineales bacterium]OQY91838.1 MAG: hypothetical protein B6D39_05585 [Anaerolineae bacterium UTCFX2]
MITDQNIQELLHYQPGQPVLSVYLNTDPAEGNTDFHRRRLRSMLKEIDLPEDVEKVIGFIEHEHDWVGKSLAVFSCVNDGFLRAYPLAIPLRSRVRVSEQPYVKPLADLLDSYGGYGVVVVDKQDARYFHFHLGELREQEDVVGETIRHTKRGGGSQAAGRRGSKVGQTGGHLDEAAERNMREAAEYAVHFFSEKNVRRILIGGTDDNVAMFRNLLPKTWQSLVVGSFPISMVASNNEVLANAIEIGTRAEILRESNLVKTLVTNAAKSRGGVLGLQETLDALREGRLQILVIRDGFRDPGLRCTGCGYVSIKAVEACPYCGGKMERIEDAVELAVQAVMLDGGEVEVLRADQKIKGFDQIGAILRY